MELNMSNFTKASYEVFSLFNERWGLATAGVPEEYNTMTIGWGTLGTIWGPPNRGKQIVTVFLRENRYTTEILMKHDRFTVCFFSEEHRRDLWTLGMKSGREVPDKISETSLTPKPLGNAVGFEEAELTFVCKKLYVHKMLRDELPEDVKGFLYREGEPLHYLCMGEIEDVFGQPNRTVE